MGYFTGMDPIKDSDLENVNTEELQGPINDLSEQKDKSMMIINGSARECENIGRACMAGDTTGIALAKSWHSLAAALESVNDSVEQTLDKYIRAIIAYQKHTQKNEENAAQDNQTIKFKTFN